MADLTIGGTPVSFVKSDELVAVRASAAMTGALGRAIDKVAPAATAGERLGGFKVLHVGAEPQSADATLDALRTDPAVAVGTHVYHSSDDLVPFVPTGQLYVEFAADASPEQQEAALAEHRVEILDARAANAFVVRVTPGSPNPMKVAEALQANPFVAVAEPELATPADPKAFAPPQTALLAEQWHLRNTGTHRGTTVGFRAGADARVVDAWTASRSLGDERIVLAVIDDGFDLAHPDLAVPTKIVGPWDFTRNSADPRPDPDLQNWHGTACAGVAAARARATGVFGAAPGVRLMPVRWGPELADGQIERWFGYVAANGASVVSCSWGALARNYPLSTRAKRAIEACATTGRGGRGCVVVFAAGNENRPVNDPASASIAGFAIHPNVICVAASTSRDERANYSNFGAEVSICAPSSGDGGWGVLTCDVTGTRVISGVTIDLGYNEGDYNYGFGGTSSATPLVAGVCALLLSERPTLTARDVRDLIEASARKIGGLGPGDSRTDQLGHGCVDAAAALRAAAAS